MAIDELAPGSSHERQARAAAWAGAALALIDAYQAQYKDSQQTGAD
jgi:hypothetical protein